jgi:hypothetical protein
MLPMAERRKPDWSKLPNELVNKIGDCFVSTEDLDWYYAYCTVCREWHGATKDPEFYITNWILIDHTDGFGSFMNLKTGRFLRKSIHKILCRFGFHILQIH